MKKLQLLILIQLYIFSFLFSAVYSIGDTVSIEHQIQPLAICYGENEGSTIYLSDNIGKITVLGLEIPW